MQHMPQFTPEGIAYFAYDTQVAGSLPVYRFYNTATGDVYIIEACLPLYLYKKN